MDITYVKKHHARFEPMNNSLFIDYIIIDFVTGQFVKILSPACSWKM